MIPLLEVSADEQDSPEVLSMVSRRGDDLGGILTAVELIKSTVETNCRQMAVVEEKLTSIQLEIGADGGNESTRERVIRLEEAVSSIKRDREATGQRSWQIWLALIAAGLSMAMSIIQTSLHFSK